MPDAPYDLTNLFSSVANGAGAVASSIGQASSVTIQTQLSPPVTFTPGAGGQPEASGPGSGFPTFLNPLVWLKPQVTVTVAGQSVVVAPYGAPDGNYLPHLAAVGAGAVGIGLLLWGAKKAAKWSLYAAAGALVYGVLANRSQASS